MALRDDDKVMAGLLRRTLASSPKPGVAPSVATLRLSRRRLPACGHPRRLLRTFARRRRILALRVALLAMCAVPRAARRHGPRRRSASAQSKLGVAVESLLAGSRTRCLDSRDIFWRPSSLANVHNSRHERARKRAARRHVAPRSGSATRICGSGTTAASGRSQRSFERSTESAIGFCRTRFANEREAIAIARISRACKRASRLQRAIGFAGVSHAIRQKSTRSTDQRTK